MLLKRYCHFSIQTVLHICNYYVKKLCNILILLNFLLLRKRELHFIRCFFFIANSTTIYIKLDLIIINFTYFSP